MKYGKVIEYNGSSGYIIGDNGEKYLLLTQNIISNDNPLYKEYECCGAKITIQALLTGHEEEIRCLECYNEKTLFSGGSDNKIKVWDILNQKFLYDLEGHVHGIQCLKLIENGKKLLSGGYDNVIRVWDWEKKNQEFFLEGHTGHIMCIDNFDDQFIVSAGTDWKIKLYVSRNIIRDNK